MQFRLALDVKAKVEGFAVVLRRADIERYGEDGARKRAIARWQREKAKPLVPEEEEEDPP